MVKVAIVGQIQGQFRAVIAKLNALQEKQSFVFVLFTGNVFNNSAQDSESDDQDVDDLLAGRIPVSVPIYFSLGDTPLPHKVQSHVTESGGEVCPNLFFLGRKGSIKTAEGVRIVALGGKFTSSRHDPVQDSDIEAVYTTADVAALSKDGEPTDIILSSDWPAQISNGSKRIASDLTNLSVNESAEMASLCTRLRPRYHFSSSPNLFFEREPFLQPHNDTKQDSDNGLELYTTRFISLAAFNNPEKQKWIYAFNLDPADTQMTATSVPNDTTPSPLIVPPPQRKRAGDNELGSYSRFANDSKSGNQRGPKRRRPPPPTPAECFFCLANPNIASHLITSIGDDAYVTTAKGPLPTSSTFPDLGGFPCHMLIIPLAHTPTLSFIEEPETRQNTISEMTRFRTAIQDMVAKKSNGKLGVVTWEVSRPTGVHAHWQIVPVPVELIKKGLVEAAFKVEADNRKYPPFYSSAVESTTASYQNGDEESSAFFRVRIWSPSTNTKGDEPQETDALQSDITETEMTLELDPSAYFDLQFGRHVLAQLMGLDDRKQWKDCVQSEEEESAESEAFKKTFGPFDFTV